MKDYAYPLFRTVISLIVAGHIVIMEHSLLRNFQVDSTALSLAVSLITVAAVLLLSLTRFFIVPLFLLNISLYFIKDLFNEEINPVLLISSMVFIAVLLTSQVYSGTEKNQVTPGHAKPSYILTLAILFISVIAGVSLLFNNLLTPHIPESAKFYLIKPNEVPEKVSPIEDPELQEEKSISMEASQEADYSVEITDTAGSTELPLFKYIDLFALLTGILLLALVLLLAGAVIQLIRYKRWERNLLRAAPGDQAVLIYRYALSMLARYGWKKEVGTTPYEFAATSSTEGFPFPPQEFHALTQAFAEIKYGQHPISDAARSACLDFYHSMPKALKSLKGTLHYYNEARKCPLPH